MDDRTDLMIEILRSMQERQTRMERRLDAIELRLSAMEDYLRGLIVSNLGRQSELDDLKARLARVEQRLGLVDPAH